MITYDVLIVGGGLAGLSLALAIAEKTPLSVALIEAKPAASHWSLAAYSPRVSAISLASQRFFESIGVWAAMAAMRVSPFRAMDVWEEAGKGRIHFDSQAIGEKALGYIVENEVMLAALKARVAACMSIDQHLGVQLTSCEPGEKHVLLQSIQGEEWRARLVVAADGANSWVRRQVGIAVNRHDYAQAGVVTTVATTKPHEAIARQVFLKTGPLGFLPLNPLQGHPHLSSIVWSLPNDQAQSLLQVTDVEFCERLSQAMPVLGDVCSADPRYAFPLVRQCANQYVASRIALVGDAAHVVHPLAGQGFNMGLMDVACLVDVLQEATKKGRDVANPSVLRRYERWRFADNAPLLIGMDAIKNMFSTENKFVRFFCSVGLRLTDNQSLIKNQLIRHAVGHSRSLLPKLMLP